MPKWLKRLKWQLQSDGDIDEKDHVAADTGSGLLSHAQLHPSRRQTGKHPPHQKWRRQALRFRFRSTFK